MIFLDAANGRECQPLRRAILEAAGGKVGAGEADNSGGSGGKRGEEIATAGFRRFISAAAFFLPGNAVKMLLKSEGDCSVIERRNADTPCKSALSAV